MILESADTHIAMKPLEYKDAICISDLGSDLEIARVTAEPGKFPYPYTVSNAVSFIAYSIDKMQSKSEFNFGIHDQDGALMGVFGIFNLNYSAKKCEIGFWLGKKFWGKGFGSEGVKMLLKFSFGNLGMNKVYARVFSDNLKASSLLERLGFKLEGNLKDEIRFGKKYKNVLIYSILSRDYLKIYKNYNINIY